MWGPSEVDLDRRVGLQHEGLLRVRRSLVVATVFLVALAVVGSITGGLDTGFGIFAVLIAPLLLILAGLQVIVALTRPKRKPGSPDSHPSKSEPSDLRPPT